ncbi:MAG: transglycosylase domain-containing protein [Sporichthyaceae bacterium]
MKPFRRRPPNSAPATGPQHADDDQWFRPEPASRRRDRRASAKDAAAAPDEAKAVVPASPDDPTEAIDVPPDWKDATARIQRVVEFPPGSEPVPPVSPDTENATVKAPKKRKKRRKSRIIFATFAWGTLSVVAAGFAVLLFAYSRIEIPEAKDSATLQTTQVFYADGQPIGSFGDVNREIVPLDRVPDSLRKAVLSAENRNFYNDNGVSPTGIARAFWVNLRGGGTQQGGSTITQQYVKNYYLSSERTIQRKLTEALLAIKLDKDLSKDQILQDYLNTIYFGRGAYGVQAAAKAYFNVDVEKLTQSQGIVLASVIRAPSRYNPTDPEGLAFLKGRWKFVADGMAATGAITPAERTKLKFPSFPKNNKSVSKYAGQKGYILFGVRKELRNRGLSAEEIENGGFKIYTTFTKQAQDAATAAYAKEFPGKDEKKVKGLRMGLVAVEPRTGKVLAMFGGEDFLGKDKYAQVNAATYPIQAGSTLKVFTVAALLESGKYSLGSTFTGNGPLKLPGSRPVNNEFDRNYGSVNLRYALAQSVNTAFVQATFKLGSSKVRAAMEKAGIPADTPGLETNARITLGIASTRPIDVADAIATLCGGGIRAEAHMVERVLQPNGGERAIRKPDVSNGPVFDPGVVSETIKAMQGVIQGGTGTAAKKLNRPAAGKTGTHQDLTAWFSGCTPQLAASVVYFKGDGTKSLDGTAGMSTFFGGTYPARTWTTFMKAALRGQPVKKFEEARIGGEKDPNAAPDPYDTQSGIAPTTKPGEISLDEGPKFDPFDLGPNSFTPAPKVTKTPTPKPTSTSKLEPVCTNDRKKEQETLPYNKDCTKDGQLPKPAAQSAPRAPSREQTGTEPR